MILFNKYPQIGQFKDMMKEITFLKFLPDKLTFIGTVKVHGTHADICQDEYGNITIQSRNRIINVYDDNCGFANFINDKAHILFDRIRLVKPNSKKIMISGEFCGKKIQSGVAISNLDPIFIIFDIYLDNCWYNIKEFSIIEDSSLRIYNIYNFKTFEIKVDKDKIIDRLDTIQSYTEEIGLCCPVAQKLGFNGKGEGIVWRCKEDKTHRLWFKTKCNAHAVVNEKIKLPPSYNKVFAVDFAHKYTTDERLHQGLDYLREYNLPYDTSSMGVFIKWVVEDIFREYNEEPIDIKVIPLCRKDITKLASEWYKRYYQIDNLINEVVRDHLE